MLTLEEAKALVAKDPKSASVIYPYLIGDELNPDGQPTRFIIDIAAHDVVSAEAMAPGAMQRLRKMVLPQRQERAKEEAKKNRLLLEADPGRNVTWHRKNFLDRWWKLAWRRGEMVRAITALPRYIALSRVAVWTRQSVYVFVSPKIRPGDAVQVFAFDDDYSFGILHSTYHRAYFEERCSKMRVDLRYTPSTVFDTFPWPQAPSEDAVAGVVDVAARLIVYRDEKIAEGITLESLYNSLRDPGRNPLRNLQEELDEAVAAVYGFDPEEDPLGQLLALNQSIAAEESSGITQPRGPGSTGLKTTRRTRSKIEPKVRLTRDP